jgi:cell division protein FtsB
VAEESNQGIWQKQVQRGGGAAQSASAGFRGREWFRRYWYLAAVLSGLLSGWTWSCVVCGANGWVAYQQKKVERLELQSELRQLQRDNDELARHVKGLQSDPRVQEEEARKQGYLRQREQAYRLKADPNSASPPSSPCGPLAPAQAGCGEAASHAGARGTRLCGRSAVVLAFLAAASGCAALRLFWFVKEPSQRRRRAGC